MLAVLEINARSFTQQRKTKPEVSWQVLLYVFTYINILSLADSIFSPLSKPKLKTFWQKDKLLFVSNLFPCQK